MDKKKRLNFNTPAPDAELLDNQGKLVKLSTLWKQKSILLAFTRHFGCTQCKEMLLELVEGKTAIEKAGLQIVIVTQGNPKETTEFAAEFAPGLTCYSDPDRKAYQAYVLDRGNLFETFINPKVWQAISKSKRKGYAVETPPAGQDALQMSGTFIINQNGLIELPYYYDHIADHPALDLLLTGVLSTPWGKEFNGPIGSPRE